MGTAKNWGGVLLAVFIFSVTAFARPQIEIVGGDLAKAGEFPSIVDLRDDQGTHICGGTLIRHDWVVTAAHCLGDVTTVVTGLNSGDASIGTESFHVAQAFEHPKHNQPIASSNDSGGPLILRAADGSETLVGLTSWGDGCARPHAFGVYSRVDAVSDWIEKTISEN